VQDLGRPGYAALGVPESGALDPAALRLANRLVGNPETAAGLEITFGGLKVVAQGSVVVAVTGAPVPISVAGTPAAFGSAIALADGAVLQLGAPDRGVRSYLAVRGGVAARQHLGSASTDLLSGLGAPLREGDVIAVHPPPATPVPALDFAPADTPTDAEIRLRATWGPRQDWFTAAAVRALTRAAWTVAADCNRIGLRLYGPELSRRVDTELPSEGTVAGSLQVPSNGQPVLLLADHPVTGGYPVLAVVLTTDLGLAAQARPGQTLRFEIVSGPKLAQPKG
jgi:biotin-dependent carboxylase-like uncharacterized protein